MDVNIGIWNIEFPKYQWSNPHGRWAMGDFAFFTGMESLRDDSTGWAGIFRALTNENIVDINKVMELPIHTILFDLNEIIRFNLQSKPTSDG